MRNAPLMTEVLPPNARQGDRRKNQRYTVVSAAKLRQLGSHADAVAEMPEQQVMVHDLSLDGIGFRSRLPVDICAQYRVECSDRKLFLKDSRVRIVSCRRGEDGMYEIGSQILR